MQQIRGWFSLKPPFEREEEEAPKKEKKKSKKNPPEVKEEKDGGDELKKRGDLRVKCRVSEDILLCREDYRDFLDVRSLLSLPLGFILFMISFVLSLSSYLPLSPFLFQALIRNGFHLISSFATVIKSSELPLFSRYVVSIFTSLRFELPLFSQIAKCELAAAQADTLFRGNRFATS